MSGTERYIERYRAHTAALRTEHVAPPDRRRMLVLTAAFTPMSAVAALPITAAVAVVATLLGNATARWVGVVLLVVAAIGLGYLTARWAARDLDAPDATGWRRWLPLGATVVVVGACVAEMASGSRAPDPVIVLWIASIAWVFAFLPLAAGAWGPARRALWLVGPVLTLLTIVFVWTQGFFGVRFDRAVADLDALARQVADGVRVADGTGVGGFTVHDVNFGRLARRSGCDVELWITGWHQEDTRYIARCIDPPRGDFTHLSGDWWELEGRTPPSRL